MSAPTLGDSAAAAEASVNAEQPQAVDPLAAVPVAEGGSGEQRDRERQVVGVHRPLQIAEIRVQALAQRRQRVRDDQGVQRGHEHTE